MGRNILDVIARATHIEQTMRYSHIQNLKGSLRCGTSRPGSTDRRFAGWVSEGAT